MEIQNYNISDSSYHVLNKDVELCGKYFDVVPDGNLYTMDDAPIFAIRMRPMGIAHIMQNYQKKYGFHTDILTYKINSDQYTLYTNNALQMYNTQKDALIKYFDFSKCGQNNFRGIIIVITNNADRLIHAIPYLYGVVDGRKKIIFLDPFFNPDIGSGCIIGADFFYRVHNGDIDCYCHGETIQADHHSCGIIACDFIKLCLKNNCKIAKKIMKNVVMRTEIDNNVNIVNSWVNIYSLPTELRRFSQIRHDKAQQASVDEVSDESEKNDRSGWFAKHIRTLIYRKDPEPYNPVGDVIPQQEGVKKSVNTSLLEKGHQYAGQIVKDLKQNTSYNSKYWLSLIREQKEGNIIGRLMKRAKHIVKNSEKNQ